MCSVNLEVVDQRVEGSQMSYAEIEAALEEHCSVAAEGFVEVGELELRQVHDVGYFRR